MEGRGKWEIPEKTLPPTPSSGTIPTCENSVTRPRTESFRLGGRAVKGEAMVCSSVGMNDRRVREIPERKKNPPTSGIVWRGSHLRKYPAVTRPGIKPGSLWWEASRLTARPPQPLFISAKRLIQLCPLSAGILKLRRPFMWGGLYRVRGKKKSHLSACFQHLLSAKEARRHVQANWRHRKRGWEEQVGSQWAGGGEGKKNKDIRKWGRESWPADMRSRDIL
ncbi:hypothetical protein PR048_025954 [Dryococelus australis]|uniref:Uncharacterized protein n=1 Tax=Dryococelus australis TaxID=614101 RepID=A0ABQ9GK06_9NEOP|nr:hypothetical protein PR048_025954 [Dryococelus australis]